MDKCQVFKVQLLWESIEKLFHLKDSQVKGLSYNPVNNSIRLGKDHKLHFSFKSKTIRRIKKSYTRIHRKDMCI